MQGLLRIAFLVSLMAGVSSAMAQAPSTGRNAGHTDHATRAQTLPEALKYVWQGYPIAGAKK
jgi:hypothetical protein